MGHRPRVAGGGVAPEWLMTAGREQQIKVVLAATLELEPPAREAYLNEVCGRDSGLRDEIRRLLSAEAIAGPQFLGDSSPVAEAIAGLEFRANRWIDRRVGDYRIDEE